MAFLLRYADGDSFDVAAVDRVWASILLVPGQVYQEKHTRSFFLSLGFIKYATLALPLKKVSSEGGDAWKGGSAVSLFSRFDQVRLIKAY